jgi:hypothetical protein
MHSQVNNKMGFDFLTLILEKDKETQTKRPRHEIIDKESLESSKIENKIGSRKDYSSTKINNYFYNIKSL